jgi:hypothetical protein
MSGAPFSAAAGRPPPDDRTLREFPSNSGVLPSARRHRPAPAAPTYATSPHRSKLPASAWATAHAEPYSSSRSRAIRVARSRCSAVPVGHDLHPSQKGSGIKPGTVQGPLRRARGQSFISRQSPTCLGCFHPSCGRRSASGPARAAEWSASGPARSTGSRPGGVRVPLASFMIYSFRMGEPVARAWFVSTAIRVLRVSG